MYFLMPTKNIFTKKEFSEVQYGTLFFRDTGKTLDGKPVKLVFGVMVDPENKVECEAFHGISSITFAPGFSYTIDKINPYSNRDALIGMEAGAIMVLKDVWRLPPQFF